jgi:hypothetical protein
MVIFAPSLCDPSCRYLLFLCRTAMTRGKRQIDILLSE